MQRPCGWRGHDTHKELKEGTVIRSGGYYADVGKLGRGQVVRAFVSLLEVWTWKYSEKLLKGFKQKSDLV